MKLKSKKNQAWTGFELGRLRYRCSTLPPKLSSDLGAGHIEGVRNIPVEGKKCKLNCAKRKRKRTTGSVV